MVAICLKLFSARAVRQIKQNFKTGLYVVATPIGNMRDITLRALDILACADLVLCEDTRVTRKLFSHHGLATPLQTYHEHNGEKMRPKVIARLAKGEVIALISDAGTPLISDPGYQLISNVRHEGFDVIAVPGASSPIAALSIAGLPPDKFMFFGFLPPKTKARQKALLEVRDLCATLIVFESAHRLASLLADIHHVLGDREVAVCRELTKKFEQVKRARAENLIAYYQGAGAPKGEIVVLIKGAHGQDAKWDADELRGALVLALVKVGTKKAADEVAELSGWSRRDVYQLALKLQNEAST